MKVFKEYQDCVCPRHSPWGHCDHIEKIAPGMYSVATPGHGGIYLSPERQEAARAMFPNWVSEYGDGWRWLEEDLDWAAACIVFYDEWDARSVHYACKSVREYQSGAIPTLREQCYYFGEIRDWLLSDAGADCRHCGVVHAERLEVA